jgi:hypothetical protein
MTLKQLVKEKYSSDRYKIWKWNKTIILYDRKTKTKTSLNKELKEYQWTKTRQTTLDRKLKRDTRKPITRQREQLSGNHAHLYKCKCVVEPNTQSPNPKGSNNFFEQTHYYYYETDNETPRYTEAFELHNQDYPHHTVINMSYIHTKTPKYNY